LPEPNESREHPLGGVLNPDGQRTHQIVAVGLRTSSSSSLARRIIQTRWPGKPIGRQVGSWITC